MMTKEVLVFIQGLQFADADIDAASTDEELDKIETICPGEYFFRNNTHYVMFEEVMDEITEPVKNMIKIKDNEFSISKKGPINVQMVFSEGKKTMTDYFTPFGNIMIALDTHSIDIENNEDSLKVCIKYALEANYQFIADCNITVEVKSKGENNTVYIVII